MFSDQIKWMSSVGFWDAFFGFGRTEISDTHSINRSLNCTWLHLRNIANDCVLHSILCSVHWWSISKQETYTKSIKFKLLAPQSTNARVISLRIIFIYDILRKTLSTTKISFMSILIFVVCFCFFPSLYRSISVNGHWIPHIHVLHWLSTP